MHRSTGVRISLVDALAIQGGIVCFVGAGGKKSTLYRLAAAYPGRIAVTATVHIPPFPEALNAHRIVAEYGTLLEAVRHAGMHRTVALAQPSIKPGRLRGLAPSEVRHIHEAGAFHVTLVKADGARSRLIKAPAPDEPQLPEYVSTVVPIVSARAIGERLSDSIAHRPDRISAVTGVESGETITPEHVARLLTDEQGALKGIGKATVVPLINMVDEPEQEALARQVAKWALALTRRFDRVVLASMLRDAPIVDVITR
ncbi:MAG: selenium cofactor biosynthesis protein YqeC [Gammaproteobacteria bacterium]